MQFQFAIWHWKQLAYHISTFIFNRLTTKEKKTQPWPQDWKRSVFIPVPKNAMPKNVQTAAQLHLLHLLTKVMLKILQASLQQYVYWERPGVQVGFRKGIGTREWIANIHWMIEKAREFQKNMYFCFIDYTKAFDCVDHNKWWKRDGNTIPPYILPEKPVWGSKSNSWNHT